MLAILFQLTADQGEEIELETAFPKRLLVFLRDLADLLRERIHGLEQTVGGFGLAGERFLEIGYGFVSQRSEPGRHDEKRSATLPVDRDLFRADDFVTRRHARIGDADDPLVHDHSQTKRHALLPAGYCGTRGTGCNAKNEL